MNKRTFEQAFNAIFHGKSEFEDFCSLEINDEIETFTTVDGRLVHRPSDKLKNYLRFIDRVMFRSLAKDEDVVHSFVKGKSTLTAIQAHTGNKYFFITDICDFYPNVKSTNVFHILKRDKELIPISDIGNYIDLMVNMTTFTGSLPVGFPTSPQLSNAFLFEFDQNVKKYCIDHDLIYTRYADDIIISGKSFKELSELKNLIQSLLKKHASPMLLLNEKKTHITQFNNKVKILGLIILPNGRVTIDAKYKKKIELALFFFTNNKDHYNSFINEEFRGDERSLFGLLHYAKSVDAAYIEKLQRKYGLYVLRKLMEDKRDD
ncbi:MAG: reverse transcriptase domain-containing protein [Mucilaginibacter sp.]